MTRHPTVFTAAALGALLLMAAPPPRLVGNGGTVLPVECR